MSITPEEIDWNEDLERRTRVRRRADADLQQETEWVGRQDPWLSGVPSWVKAVAVVGIPGVIALFLVYQVASQLPKIEERQATIEKQLDTAGKAADRESAKMDQMFRMLQRICSNTAKNDEDRQRCFD